MKNYIMKLMLISIVEYVLFIPCRSSINDDLDSMLPEPEAFSMLEREPDSLPNPANDIGPASPIQ